MLDDCVDTELSEMREVAEIALDNESAGASPSSASSSPATSPAQSPSPSPAPPPTTTTTAPSTETVRETLLSLFFPSSFLLPCLASRLQGRSSDGSGRGSDSGGRASEGRGSSEGRRRAASPAILRAKVKKVFMLLDQSGTGVITGPEGI